jgi:hypothetical protein
MGKVTIMVGITMAIVGLTFILVFVVSYLQDKADKRHRKLVLDNNATKSLGRK